jgi:cbb3-type cytochrome oxidase subunit 3
MIREHLTQFVHLVPWAIASLLTFVGLFVAMVAWLFRRGARPYYARAGALPLGEDHDG